MIREPHYSDDVELILNGLQQGSDARLLNAVCNAIDLICDQGDAAKARRQLGWKPRVSFPRLVAEMAREDLQKAERDALISRHGYRAYGGRE